MHLHKKRTETALIIGLTSKIGFLKLPAEIVNKRFLHLDWTKGKKNLKRKFVVVKNFCTESTWNRTINQASNTKYGGHAIAFTSSNAHKPLLENDKSWGSINIRENYTNSAGLTPPFLGPSAATFIYNIFTTAETTEQSHHDVRSSGTEHHIRRRFSYRLWEVTGTRAGAYTKSLHSLPVITQSLIPVDITTASTYSTWW